MASLIAIRLFQDYSRDQSLAELSREASGLSQLYSLRAGAEPINADALQQATGDRLFVVGVNGIDFEFLDDGQEASLKQLEAAPAVRRAARGAREREADDVRVHAARRGTFLAVSTPLKGDENTVFGALVVAKPKAELRDRWVTLAQRLALGILVGLAVACALAWYLSRRLTKPLLTLSRAADEVAEGHYAVDLPEVRGADEISHLAARFGQMATRLQKTEELERNFLMSVSHELRTPLTAIRGHVEALREGLVEDPSSAPSRWT